MVPLAPQIEIQLEGSSLTVILVVVVCVTQLENFNVVLVAAPMQVVELWPGW